VLALGVVEPEVVPNPGSRLRHRLAGPQIDGFIFDAASEALDKHIVQPAALAVHADLDPCGFQNACEGLVGELGALVGVEDLRGAIAASGLLQ
jgi:hypothetical protein